jgi:prevent-host-death family protein
MVDTVGVRELRQNASELIRRAESGEEITVAVSGRPAARLVPLRTSTRTWRRGVEIAGIWSTPNDLTWDSERRADPGIDQSVVDAWEHTRR